MITTSFRFRKAKQIEVLVCEEFGCSIYDIVCYTHSLRKWLFSFVTEHGFNKRNIGLKYQITYLYVPTVVSEIEYQIKNIADYSKVSSA
jgi:hypothetical protein